VTAASSPGEVGGKPLHGWSCSCGDAGPGDHAERRPRAQVSVRLPDGALATLYYVSYPKDKS
jgi:hypothetical protein